MSAVVIGKTGIWGSAPSNSEGAALLPTSKGRGLPCHEDSLSLSQNGTARKDSSLSQNSTMRKDSSLSQNSTMRKDSSLSQNGTV
ncbi:MAG: hypothetical protein IKZ87_03090 [Actinomycetaceae bacterium]|nr:hypothetical protein [Actinomycetaceae bacterium]